jgi:hypothetical protein
MAEFRHLQDAKTEMVGKSGLGEIVGTLLVGASADRTSTTFATPQPF